MVRKASQAFSNPLGFQARHSVSAHHPLPWGGWTRFLDPSAHYTRHEKKETKRELARQNPRIHCLKILIFPASHDVSPQIDELSSLLGLLSQLSRSRERRGNSRLPAKLVAMFDLADSFLHERFLSSRSRSPTLASCVPCSWP